MIVRKHIRVTAFLLAFVLVAATLPTEGREGDLFEKTPLVANAEENSVNVATLAEFQAAIENPDISVITLTSNIALPTGTYDCENKQIMTGNYYFTIASTETVHLNNADIDMGGNSAFQNSGIFYGDNIDVHGGTIVFVYSSSNSNTKIIVSNSKFHDNRNNQQTFARTSGIMVIDNCSFYNNVNTNTNNDGAIIETNSGGMVYIYRSTFANNCGYAHAGCINDYGGYLYIADSIFTGNTIKASESYYSGGGIRGSGGLKMMISTVLAYNKYADGAKDGDIGSLPTDKNVNNVIGYVGGSSTGADTAQYFSEYDESSVGDSTIAFSHPKIDENGNVSVNTDALNQLWSTTNAQLDYSDLNDIKLTYTDPVTGERVELGSSWTIYYYNNDGTDTVITDSVSKLSSSSYRLLAEPTRTGYRFLGWYTNSSMSGTPRSAGSYYSVSNDTSFYAGWIRSDRIITDNTQSVSQLTITSSVNDHQSNYYSVDRDSEVTITSKTKLIFSSGSFTETKSGDTYTYIGIVSEDITVRTAYTISFETNGGSTIEAVIVPHGNSISLNSYFPSKTCYAFKGWYRDENLTTPVSGSSVTVNSDVTYYAKWVEKHDWDSPTYDWAEDNSTCTKTVICKDNSSHKKVETVDTTSEIASDEIVYTAVFSNQQTKYSHTSNINDDGVSSGNYDNSLNTNEVITIDGADSLHVVLTYQTESTSCDWVSVWEGEHPEYTAYNNYSTGLKSNGNTTGKYGGTTKTIIEFDVEGDSVTFGFRSDGSVNNYYGYYAVVTGGTTDIQTKREPYVFTPTYTVTIPADVNLSSNSATATVKAECDIGDQKLSVTVTSANGYYLKADYDDSVLIPYTLRREDIRMDDSKNLVLSMTGESTKEQALNFSVNPNNVYAGSYRDTLTFNISLT